VRTKPRDAGAARSITTIRGAGYGFDPARRQTAMTWLALVISVARERTRLNPSGAASVRRALIPVSGAIVIVLGVRETLRRMPELETKVASRLEEMMAAMPEQAPPARIQRELTTIREQTATRFLQLLEEDKGAQG
jgi:hypothetical protein